MAVLNVAVRLDGRTHGPVQSAAADLVGLHELRRRAVDARLGAHAAVAVVGDAVRAMLSRLEAVYHLVRVAPRAEGEIVPVKLAAASAAVASAATTAFAFAFLEQAQLSELCTAMLPLVVLDDEFEGVRCEVHVAHGPLPPLPAPRPLPPVVRYAVDRHHFPRVRMQRPQCPLLGVTVWTVVGGLEGVFRQAHRFAPLHLNRQGHRPARGRVPFARAELVVRRRAFVQQVLGLLAAVHASGGLNGQPRVGHAPASASAASASSSSLSRVVDVDRAFVALRRRAVRRLELVRELLQSGVLEAAHGKSGVALLLHDALQVRDGVRRPPVLWSICAAAGEEIEPVGLRNHFEVEYKKKSEGTVLIYGWATGMN